MTVAAGDAQTGPEIVGPTSFTVVEGETAVGTIRAADDDTPAADLVWSMAGGADSGHFALGANGVLAFGAAKDYEAPDDAGGDGTYFHSASSSIPTRKPRSPSTCHDVNPKALTRPRDRGNLRSPR